MNTKLIDFEPFVEWDNSPFILFSSVGKIIYLNSAAEILFGYVSKKELYDLALSYAPQDFGHRSTTIALNYDLLSFYALTVGYQNEDEIALRLYHSPCTKDGALSAQAKQNKTLIMTDINTLLEANLTLFRINSDSKISLLTDQELPPFKIDQNSFSKLLRDVLSIFSNSKAINISLKLLIGRHVIIGDKKESIVQLRIQSQNHTLDISPDISKLATECHTKIIFTPDSIKLEIPAIR